MKIRGFKIIGILLAGFFLFTIVTADELRHVKVTVTEEDGAPIKNATVTVTFLGYSGKDTARKSGLSDEYGVIEISGRPPLRMKAWAEKSGYYSTKSGRLSRTQNHDVVFILRKKRKPIPLYAKKVHLYLPENRKWLGYDFEVSDWIAPHGDGKVADMFLWCDTEKTGWAAGNGEFKIRFENEGGIKIEETKYMELNQMKMPHLAPADGYQSDLYRKEKSFYNKNMKRNIGYFFKSRVTSDRSMQISANYGKIMSDFRFDPRESGWHVSDKGKPKSYATISFAYYFNPTPNDRNLEFDTNNNLFKNLEHIEMVREP